MLKLQWVSKVAKLQSFPLKSCWIVLTLKTACCLRRRRRRPPSPSPSPSQAVARCAPAPAAPRRIICKDCYNFLPQIIEITSLYSVFFTWHMEIWLKLGKFDKNYWNFDLKLWKFDQKWWKIDLNYGNLSEIMEIWPKITNRWSYITVLMIKKKALSVSYDRHPSFLPSDQNSSSYSWN